MAGAVPITARELCLTVNQQRRLHVRFCILVLIDFGREATEVFNNRRVTILPFSPSNLFSFTVSVKFCFPFSIT